MSEKIGEAINGFEQLRARQVTIHEWRVLSWRNDSITAHKVDIRDLDCDCADDDFNQTNPEVCDHIAVALNRSQGTLDVGDAVKHDAYKQMLKLDEHVRTIERRAAGIDAQQDTSAHAGASDDSQGSSEGFNGDPVESMKSYLTGEGLDPADFKIFVDDQFGSLQIEVDGYLGDDEFDTWVDLSDKLGLAYDGENDRNYLKEEEFPEVFG